MNACLSFGLELIVIRMMDTTCQGRQRSISKFLMLLEKASAVLSGYPLELTENKEEHHWLSIPLDGKETSSQHRNLVITGVMASVFSVWEDKPLQPACKK